MGGIRASWCKKPGRVRRRPAGCAEVQWGAGRVARRVLKSQLDQNHGIQNLISGILIVSTKVPGQKRKQGAQRCIGGSEGLQTRSKSNVYEFKDQGNPTKGGFLMNNEDHKRANWRS